jgi:hypothetical protein
MQKKSHNSNVGEVKEIDIVDIDCRYETRTKLEV